MNLSWNKLVMMGVPSFVIGYCITFFGFKSVTAVPGQSVELVELFFTYCSPNVLMMTLPLFLATQKIHFSSAVIRRFSCEHFYMYIWYLDVSLSFSWSMLYACRIIASTHNGENDCMYRIFIVGYLGFCLYCQKIR